MSLQRFRDFDEARQALWGDGKDPELAARLWEVSEEMTGVRAA